MKQLVCEMCGSKDLVKDSGLFICQSCGCKYTVEEAKKMMIEGTVDVSGSTIKIDNAAKLENLRQLAERAKEENDSKTATKYFEQILMEDPNDWEANFYTIYYAAHNIKIAEIGSAANRVANIIEPVFKLIKSHVADEEQQKKAYREVTSKIIDFHSLLVKNSINHTTDNYESINKELDEKILPAVCMITILGDNLLGVFKDYEYADTAYQIAEIFPSKEFATSQLKKVGSLLKERRATISQLKRDEYWAEHAEEKKVLDDEMATLQGELSTLEEQLAKLPEVEKEKAIYKALDDKNKEKDSLGFFKMKEKKALQVEIDALMKQRTEAQKARKLAEEPYTTQIKEIKERISWILEELSKDR